MLQRDNSVKWIVFAAIALVLMSALGLFFSFQKNHINVQIGSTAVNAKVADTKEERTKGLSGTAELKDNEGMLFVFDNPGNWGIWMKDMLINIDIIWLDEEKKVIHIQKNVSPSTYPEVFEPKEAAKYILEVPAGFAEKNNVGIGTLVSFRSWLW